MRFRYEYHKLACRKCGRKILVEIALFGVSHNAEVVATCAECLELSRDFKGKHAKAADDISKWMKEKCTTGVYENRAQIFSKERRGEIRGG